MKTDLSYYHRPGSLRELEILLAGRNSQMRFLAGGNFLSEAIEDGTVLVDLQDLGFDQITVTGKSIQIGGLATLEQIRQAEHGLTDLPVALSIEAGLNVRNSLSLANFLRSADNRSPFLAALLALKPTVVILPGNNSTSFEQYLLQESQNSLAVISELRIEIPKAFAYEGVGRSPKDRPMICLAVTQDQSGKLQTVCGGMMSSPKVLPLTDRSESLFTLVKQAYENSTDQWASTEYRQETAVVLLSRCLQKIGLGLAREEAR